MRTCLRLLLLLTLLVFWAAAQESARMKTVEPAGGKVGDEVTVSGENLDKKFVKEVYLTDGKADFKAEVTSQATDAIKMKIPKAPAGRYSLMILTAEAAPKLIEQPVKCTVE